jgi:hypothetical protein
MSGRSYNFDLSQDRARQQADPESIVSDILRALTGETPAPETASSSTANVIEFQPRGEE